MLSCACRRRGRSIAARYRHSARSATTAPGCPRRRPVRLRRRGSCFAGWSYSVVLLSPHKAERVMSMDNNETGRGSLMTPRLIVGVAIALFGMVLVLDRLNLVIADQVLRWWPAVIVALGALMFSQSRRVGGGDRKSVV